MERDYTLLQLAKGALVHECQRCGAIIFHKMIHDAWHETNDRYEEIFSVMFAEFTSHIMREDNS